MSGTGHLAAGVRHVAGHGSAEGGLKATTPFDASYTTAGASAWQWAWASVRDGLREASAFAIRIDRLAVRGHAADPEDDGGDQAQDGGS